MRQKFVDMIKGSDAIFFNRVTDLDEMANYQKSLKMINSNAEFVYQKVTGEIVKQGKQRKIRIFKYIDKQKSSRKRQGHRQPYTKVEIKTIRSKYPSANISPVDYDPGASEANQTNRIKLLMTVAKDNLKMQENEKKALEKENNIYS